MIGGIALTHGPIASATLEAAETILGDIDNLYALTSTGLSLKSLFDKLDKIISDENWYNGLIIMVSLKGGTGWNAAVRLANKNPNIEVVAGLNLPMLISFITKRQNQQLTKIAETIQEDAIRGIVKFT